MLPYTLEQPHTRYILPAIIVHATAVYPRSNPARHKCKNVGTVGSLAERKGSGGEAGGMGRGGSTGNNDGK